MPLKYESTEFADELKKRININKEYREKAKGMTWTTLFVVKDIRFATYSSYVDGELKERKHIAPDKIDECKKNVDFAVEIPTYDLSISIAIRKESMENLFLSGKIGVEGSIFKALQYRDAIEIAARITADLANETTIPSKDAFVKTLSGRDLQ